MSIDSLTILTRIQQRKHLAVEENDNNLILLGSGIHRLIKSEDHKQNISLFIECEQDNNSMKTFDKTSINTKSYNTSTYTKQKDVKKVFLILKQIVFYFNSCLVLSN
jgi:hypothetical protein